MRKTILFLFVAFLISSCVVTHGYYYISLEEIPGIKTLAYGKSERGNIRSHEAMPVEYELSRDRYILLIEIDRKSNWPASYIRAKSLEGLDLQVKVTADVEAVREGRAPRTPYTCSGFDFFAFDTENDTLLRYEWWGFFEGEICSLRNISADDLTMRFRVMDNAGNLLGEERLPFRLIRNGLMIEYDVL